MKVFEKNSNNNIIRQKIEHQISLIKNLLFEKNVYFYTENNVKSGKKSAK